MNELQLTVFLGFLQFTLDDTDQSSEQKLAAIGKAVEDVRIQQEWDENKPIFEIRG